MVVIFILLLLPPLLVNRNSFAKYSIIGIGVVIKIICPELLGIVDIEMIFFAFILQEIEVLKESTIAIIVGMNTRSSGKRRKWNGN